MTADQTRFLAELAPTVQTFSSRTGLPASVLLAQAILESDWGRSALSRDHNNYFGIKAPKSRPKARNVAQYPTTEFTGDKPRRVNALFAHFDSLDAGLAEYARILFLPRYARARAVAANPFAFAVELQRCGYATDPRYARKLALVIRRYQLTQYDTSAPSASGSAGSPSEVPRPSAGRSRGVPAASRKENVQ